jgi:hypothetical protein
MVTRRGASDLGCLGWLLTLAIMTYVVINVGAPYMRYYRFRDAVDQQVRYATFGRPPTLSIFPRKRTT